MMHTKFLRWTAVSLLVVLSLAACDEGLSESDSPPAEDTPRIVLDPPYGIVNSEVGISGTNFPPDTVINVYIGEASTGVIPEILVTVSTDENGEFSSTLSIPSQWPNGDPVIEQTLLIAAISEDYAASDIANFTVEPGGETTSPVLSINPSVGSPGDTIQVSGTDFIPDTQIALQMGVPQSGLNQENLAVVTIDENGQFEVEIQMPFVWPDSELPVIEETLIIGAVDESVGQTLATDTFENESAGEEVTAAPDEPIPTDEAPTEVPTAEEESP